MSDTLAFILFMLLGAGSHQLGYWQGRKHAGS